jgi:hypothetical protein
MRASKQASNQLVNGRGEKKTPLSSSLALLEKMFFFFIFVCLLSPFFESQNAHGGGEIQTPLSLSLFPLSTRALSLFFFVSVERTNDRRVCCTQKRGLLLLLLLLSGIQSLCEEKNTISLLRNSWFYLRVEEFRAKKKTTTNHKTERERESNNKPPK